VDVVRIAVVRRAHGDDGLERGRAQRGDLESVEPAPRLPHHADITRAPGLLGQPGDHRAAVIELLLKVLVGEMPLGLAGAPHVDTDGGVALPREPRVHPFVAAARAVALAIRDVFEDRRHGPALGILREP
jgi:hypothetical protein